MKIEEILKQCKQAFPGMDWILWDTGRKQMYLGSSKGYSIRIYTDFRTLEMSEVCGDVFEFWEADDNEATPELADLLDLAQGMIQGRIDGLSALLRGE